MYICIYDMYKYTYRCTLCALESIYIHIYTTQCIYTIHTCIYMYAYIMYSMYIYTDLLSISLGSSLSLMHLPSTLNVIILDVI